MYFRSFVPLFVPIGERYEGRYMGYMIEDGHCVRFLCENYQSGTKQGQFGNMENLVEYFHKQLVILIYLYFIQSFII